MLKLPQVLEINGTHCRVIKRTDKVALLSVDNGRRFEVCRIYILPPLYYEYRYYHEREAISNNSQFGHDGSKFFMREEDALKYFEKLNINLFNENSCEKSIS